MLGCQWQPAAVTDASLGFTGWGEARPLVTSHNGDLAVTLYNVNNQHLAGLLPPLKDRLDALAIFGEQRQLQWLTMHLLIRGWDRRRVTVTGPRYRADEKILPSIPTTPVSLHGPPYDVDAHSPPAMPMTVFIMIT